MGALGVAGKGDPAVLVGQPPPAVAEEQLLGGHGAGIDLVGETAQPLGQPRHLGSRQGPAGPGLDHGHLQGVLLGHPEGVHLPVLDGQAVVRLSLDVYQADPEGSTDAEPLPDVADSKDLLVADARALLAELREGDG